MIPPNPWTAQAYSAMGYLSGGVKALGLFDTGQQQESAYSFNAGISKSRAEAMRRSSELADYRDKKALAATIGAQRANFAASGVDSMTGSPLDVMVGDLSEGYLNIAIDRYNDEVAARGLESEAAMDEYLGKQAARGGRFGAALSLLESSVDFGSKNTKSEDEK